MRNLHFASAGFGVLSRIEFAHAARLLICVLEVPDKSPIAVWIPLILQEPFFIGFDSFFRACRDGTVNYVTADFTTSMSTH
jgi:hypothetical protein